MILRILLAVLLTPAWSAAQDSGTTSQPSLAELARRERERRAKQTETAQVITNATIKGMRGLVSTSGAPPAAEAPAEAAEAAEETGESASTPEVNSEEWSGKFDEARLNLKNAVNRSMVVQLKMNDLRNSYFRENDGAKKGQIQRDLQDTQKEMDGSRQEVFALLADALDDSIVPICFSATVDGVAFECCSEAKVTNSGNR